jgi:hypothetical protein
MQATCFDQHNSSSGDCKTVDESAVLPPASITFGVCPRLSAHVSVTCIRILCMTCAGVFYICTYRMVMDSST